MYAFCAYVRMYICMFVFTEGNFVLGRRVLSGGLCPGGLSVSPSSFHVQFVQPLASEFCIHNNFYFGMMAVAYMYLTIDVERVTSAYFYVFYSWGQGFLDLCIKWNTVKSASILAAGGQISPYAPSS